MGFLIFDAGASRKPQALKNGRTPRGKFKFPIIPESTRSASKSLLQWTFRQNCGLIEKPTGKCRLSFVMLRSTYVHKLLYMSLDKDVHDGCPAGRGINMKHVVPAMLDMQAT
jgi:hypothetical protein